jgi:hypothetical protein
MQEGSVGWDPISVDHQLPWQSKLFLLYLLIMIVMSILRLGGLIRQLWWPRADSSKHSSAAGRSGPEFRPLGAWDACSYKIEAMKRSVLLTFLLSVLVAADQTRTMLSTFADQKVTGPAAFCGGMTEVLTVFAVGILVCAAIYAVSTFCEGVLARRRMLGNSSVTGMNRGRLGE